MQSRREEVLGPTGNRVPVIHRIVGYQSFIFSISLFCWQVKRRFLGFLSSMVNKGASDQIKLLSCAGFSWGFILLSYNS